MDYPSIPMPQMMQMNLGGAPQKPAGGMNDMGMKILQAALKQQQPQQPQAGAVMPGGATNIVPPQPGGFMGMMGQGGGMGLLSKLFGGGGLGGAGAMGQGPAAGLNSGNAIF